MGGGVVVHVSVRSQISTDHERQDVPTFALWQLVFVACHKLAVMFDFGRRTEILPVQVEIVLTQCRREDLCNLALF